MNRLVLLVLPRRNVDFDLCRRSQRKQSQNYGSESRARHEGSVTHLAMSGGLCLVNAEVELAPGCRRGLVIKPVRLATPYFGDICRPS